MIEPMGRRLVRLVAALLLGLAVSTVLAGCGKRGSLEPPDGEEDQYTYPRQYPR